MIIAFGAAKILERDVFELDAQLFGDHLAVGENRDIFEHRFAPVAKSRGLDGDDFQRAADLVDHQSRQSFAFDLFGDDQQRFTGLGSGFKHREQDLSCWRFSSR